jgi:NAD(P)-dependent dehydrogenase (short-subunit alcohol dehydrogenase family)
LKRRVDKSRVFPKFFKATPFFRIDHIMSDDKKHLLRTPSFRLDGKVAVVTGSGRGIGKGCAMGLAQAGAHTVCVARTQADLDQTKAEIEELGGSAETLICDVTSTEQIREKIGGLDRIDILVNNAGTNIPQPFLEVPEENVDKVIAINSKAVFMVAQIAAQKMADQGDGGSIINMSSQMGQVGGPIRTVYCMTKHGVEGLTKAMACDLAEHNIRVNAIAPTFVNTPMAQQFFKNEAFKKSVMDQILLDRIADIEDIMGACVYLASPASAMVTGTSLLVDGGWTAK